MFSPILRSCSTAGFLSTLQQQAEQRTVEASLFVKFLIVFSVCLICSKTKIPDKPNRFHYYFQELGYNSQMRNLWLSLPRNQVAEILQETSGQQICR